MFAYTYYILGKCTQRVSRETVAKADKIFGEQIEKW